MATATVIVPLDNDFYLQFDMTRPAERTGAPEAAAEVVGLTFHFSLQDGGTAIANTSTALAERPDRPGRYYGRLAMADLNAALATYVNRRIYLVIVGTGVEKSEPVVIRQTGAFE